MVLYVVNKVLNHTSSFVENMFREAANTNRSLKSCTLSALRSRLPQLTIRPNKVVIQAASITPTSKTSPRINVTAAPTKATTSAIPSRLLTPNSFNAAPAKATTSAIPSRLLPPNSFKAAPAKATTSAIPSRLLPPNSFKAAPAKATTSAIPSRLLTPNSFNAAPAKATTSAIPSRLLPPNSFKAAPAKATTAQYNPMLLNTCKIYRPTPTVKKPAPSIIDATSEKEKRNVLNLKTGKLYRPKLLINTSPETVSVASRSTQTSMLDAAQTNPATSSAFESQTSEQLTVLNKSVALIWAELNYLTDHRNKTTYGAGTMQGPGHPITTSIMTLPFLTSEAELTAFNENLGNDDFFESVLLLINDKVSGKPYAKNRMHDTFMMLFDRTFLATCSWRGGGKNGPKTRLDDKANIWRLLKTVGEQFEIVTIEDVERLAKTKISNASSLKKYKGLVKSSTKCSHKRDKNNNK
ncbi:cell wall protein RBR3-like isoform X3 [Anopheles stephensi]|uniref:cell wall protein RBR3-like isoform X3 n=1 Tax=Anopheles stephensi TaxID=30069 RepID=UPI0016587A1D|nr:cell wall protein RBR3-like isoform X3 [Anopheles stephensi]